MIRRVPWAIALAAALPALATAQPPPGLYALPGDTLVSIAALDGKASRYRVYQGGASARLRECGERTWCAGPDYSTPKPVALRLRLAAGDSVGEWTAGAGPARPIRRVPLATSPASFTRDGVTLRGLLLRPPGPGPHPAVVFVHGSGKHAATRTSFSPNFIAAHGIAVLVYDKRGTGESGGRFTMDFPTLADDVVAAVAWLGRQAGIDAARLGLVGYSQGGWVAPLAASRAPAVRFIVIGYGMVDSPFEEERIQTLERLRERGVTEPELLEADTLTRAAIRVVASGFESGWDSLAAAAKRTQGRPWRGKMDGTTPGEILKYPKFVVKLLGPGRAPPGLSWDYDSRAVLERLDLPMVWMIAADDRSAPSAFTLASLERWRAQGKPYETLLFPGCDHGMLEYRVVEGERRFTRYAPDYFRREVECLRRLAGLAPAEDARP